MKISIIDPDPRAITDKDNYPYNHGSFSSVTRNLCEQLKILGYYSEPDDADFVGISDGLNTRFKYKDKSNFVINFWEYNNTLTSYQLQNAFGSDIRLFSLSNHTQKLWQKYGFKCEKLGFGIDSEFWRPTREKDDKFTFLVANSSNIRSNLDTILSAFCWLNNHNLRLVIKDTNDNPRLADYIRSQKSNNCDIEYYSDRWPMQKLRELYSSVHCTINAQRGSSAGLVIGESMACNSLNLVSDVQPANEFLTEENAVLLKPFGEISISEYLKRNNGFLLNCFPDWQCPEIPVFWDFTAHSMAETMLDIYDNWDNKYKDIANKGHQFCKDNMQWKNVAQNLVDCLEKKD